MEKTLWTQIRKKLKNFFIQRVETQIERGIPDVHYVTYGGHCGWIEGKWVKTPKRRKTKIKVNLSIEQLAWHKSYEFYGGKVFILVKKDRDVYLFYGKNGEELAKGVSFEDFEKISICKNWDNINNYLENN
tara:strand:- start:105 stop:497 length:393 start_codon:yes stop_codon:yes gene_type:complete